VVTSHMTSGHGISKVAIHVQASVYCYRTSPYVTHMLSDAIMDIVHMCLSLTPAPCLVSDFAALKLIYSSVEQVQANKGQLQALEQSIAQLLQTLNGEYYAGRLLDVQTMISLTNLHLFVLYLALCSLIMCPSIVQVTGRHFSLCSENFFKRVSEVAVY
jgi:hypothetical protein